MIPKKDLVIMAHLRQNARVSLTNMSKQTHIPVSTLFDKIKQYEGTMIQRHIALLNFTELGFATRAIILLKVNKKDREALSKLLIHNHHINSLFKVNNGYDFQLECVFSNMQQLEEFLEHIDEQYKITAKEVHYIIDEIKREAFLSDPDLLPPMTAIERIRPIRVKREV